MVGFKHQPRNPFRTAQRTEEWWLPGAGHSMNPTLKMVLQICYVAAVGALLVTVALLAISAFYQMPSPHDTGLGPSHRIASTESAHDIQQQKVIPRKGGGVRGQSRLPPAIEMNADQKSVTQHHSAGRGVEASFHHDDEEDEPVIQEEELVMLQRANPAGNDLKILGETKEQVKQEISQEEHSEHAFGALFDKEIDSDRSKRPELSEVTAERKEKEDATGKYEVQEKKSSHGVQIIRRRGESDKQKGSEIDQEPMDTREKEQSAGTEKGGRSSREVHIVGRRGESQPDPTAAGPVEDHSTAVKSTDANGIVLDTANSVVLGDDEEQSVRKRLRPIEIATEVDEVLLEREGRHTHPIANLVHEPVERKRPIEIIPNGGSEASKTDAQAQPIAIAVEE